MVHYIRFLKPAKLSQISGTRISVKALITITTDLGDDFLGTELDINTDVVQRGASLGTRNFTWKPGMRTLWVEFLGIPISALKHSVNLLVSATSRGERSSGYASMESLPEIVSSWSEPLDLQNQIAGSRVERRFAISADVTMKIFEELGESIARHIWDAGIVLAALLRDILLFSNPADANSRLARTIRDIQPIGLRVLELGSGCGLVGLQIAHACPLSHILLTDLPEAMEILQFNISQAQLALGCHVRSATLNWEEHLPETVANERFDLVLVSDCTYNSDSIPALVKTIKALMKNSPSALIVISMKVRHDSELTFFELMSDAGLKQAEYHAYGIPDMQRTDRGQALENVDVYTYCSV